MPILWCGVERDTIDLTEWHLPPIGDGLDDRWRDAFIATQLADVMARRLFDVPFNRLSVEDRNIIRGEVESFLARQVWMAQRRDRKVGQS